MDNNAATMELWSKVYYNDLILSTILRRFDIKEQMTLMEVCQRFQYIIRDVIWKRKYNNLQIQKTCTTFVLGWKKAAAAAKAPLNKGGICDRRDFDETGLYKFLEYQQRNLKALTIKSNLASPDRYEGVVFNFQGNFDNLHYLRYEDIILNDDHIRRVTERCKHLKELHLHKIGDHLTGAYLGEFRNLHTLTIEKCYATWSYENFFNIFKLNLKNVQIFDISFELKHSPSKVKIDHLAECLELLKIQKSCRYDYVFHILKETAKPLRKLRDLHVVCSSNLKDQHFQLIAQKCTNLKRLYITRCWFEIDCMTFPFSLHELYVDNCVIMSPANVWYILTQLRLSVLEISKIDSQPFYQYDFSLNVGFSLKTLKIQPFLSNDSDKEFWLEILENCTQNSFDRVETLTCDGMYAHDEYMLWISRKFVNLKNLNIEDSELSGRYIDHMSHLQSLMLSYCICFDFCNLLQILQTCRELTRLSLNYTEFENIYPLVEEEPVIDQFSLSLLRIDYDIFTVGHEFWLNLLRLNSVPIEISIRCEYFNSKFECACLLALFEDANVSRTLNRLTIEGFFNEASLENRQCFIGILYNPIIKQRVKHVRVSHRQIDISSLQRTECLDLITWCLNNYNSNDFTIELISIK